MYPHITQLLGFTVVTLCMGGALTGHANEVEGPPRPPHLQTGGEPAVAIGGFDPVSYFTETAPLEGDERHRTEWKGFVWYFSSEANRMLFEEDARRFAPQFFGYCCAGLEKGMLEPGDPQVFRIMDGRLYLFHDKDRRSMWMENLPVSRERSEREFMRIFSMDF